MASATIAPAPITSADDYSVSSDDVGSTSASIHDGFCTAHITVIGGQGGVNGAAAAGGVAEEVDALIPVTSGQVFSFHVGGSADGDSGGTNADVAQKGHEAPTTGTGGGGAGSSLTLNGGGVVASAKGGNGAGPSGGAGGGTTTFDAQHYTVEGAGVDPFQGSTNDQDNGSGRTDGGVVSVDVHACDAPYAPNVRTVDARDTSATVEFYPEDGDQGTAAPTGYEYSLGGGTWTPVTTQAMPANDGERTFTLTGLSNGQAYQVRVRATSASGDGAIMGTRRRVFTPTHLPPHRRTSKATLAPPRSTSPGTRRPVRRASPATPPSAVPGDHPQSDTACSMCATSTPPPASAL